MKTRSVYFFILASACAQTPDPAQPAAKPEPPPAGSAEGALASEQAPRDVLYVPFTCP